MSTIKIASLRKVGDEMGRSGVSEMAIKMVNDCDGSYKGVMELCGKLSVMAKVATFDEYWNEQVCLGVYRAEGVCLVELDKLDKSS